MGERVLNPTGFQNSPLNGYILQDADSGSDPKYYGYMDTHGAWYILKNVASTGTYRYAYGSADYSEAWNNRASETYTYIDGS